VTVAYDQELKTTPSMHFKAGVKSLTDSTKAHPNP
jgi:hypothetical protein